MRVPTNLLATMITSTTYGTWLPGDMRGYVDDGVILPHDPVVLERSQRRMRDEPVLLTPTQQDTVFKSLLMAADEFGYTLYAVSIESWHMHVLLTHGFDPVKQVVGRLKTRMRQAVGRGRIWTEGYDKRYCFTDAAIEARHEYIRRHRGYRPLPPTPGKAGG